MVNRYLGIEAVIAAIFYTILGGNIQIGGLRIRLAYLIIAYIILKFIYKLDGRISIGVALGLLGITAVLLVANDEPRANWAAETAYIFLVIGVAWQMAELMAENRTETKRLTAGQDRVIFWQRRGLVVGSIIIVLLAIYFGSNFLAETKKNSQPADLNKKASSRSESLEDTSTIVILNGNGLPNEAEKIAGRLQSLELGPIQVGDAETLDQLETRLHYRPNSEATAARISKRLAGVYPIKSMPDLKRDSSVKIVIVLGLDKIGLVDRSAIEIELVNGALTPGAAAETAALLNQNGFMNTVTKSGAVVGESAVRFNQKDATAAKLIARLIGEKYQPALIETPALSAGKIEIVLGLK